MKKFAIAAFAVAGLVGAGGSATTAMAAAPCATTQALAQKYGIVLNMHQEEVETSGRGRPPLP